jgi:hypothetical protein
VSVAVFNTHAFVKRLTAAGMPEALADELTPLIDERVATKDDLANLATKADLGDLKSATKADLADLKSATRADLAEIKADLMKWTFGAIGFQTVIVLGAVVALARVSH